LAAWELARQAPVCATRSRAAAALLRAHWKASVYGHEARPQPADSAGDSASRLTPQVAPLGDITVFVDPLDGTREFVEGRVWNVQVLVGIAVCGEATAGAVGLPFASGSSGSDAAVVYGMVGAGLGLGYHY
jgi:hypothetical protein